MAELIGTPENDNFEGTNQADSIFGGAQGENQTGTGDDLLNGLGGEDLIRGGDGDDVLFGGAATDTIFGEIGNDAIDGGAGNDILNGEDGRPPLQVELDNFTGAQASATISAIPVQGGIQFTVESVEPIADIRGVFFDISNDDLLDNLIVRGDNLTVTKFGPADSVRSVGSQDNFLNVNMLPGGRFDAGIEIGTSGMGDDDIRSTTFILSLDNDESLSLDEFDGQAFGLRLTSVGESEDDCEDSSQLSGNAELLVEDAEETDDVILGQSGDDLLKGEEGNDQLDGGDGDDTINGGSGEDRAAYIGSFSQLEERNDNTFVVVDSDGQDAYEITANNQGNLNITVTDLLTGGDNVASGEDELTNVEFLEFSGGQAGTNPGTVNVAGILFPSAITFNTLILDGSNQQLSITSNTSIQGSAGQETILVEEGKSISFTPQSGDRVDVANPLNNYIIERTGLTQLTLTDQNGGETITLTVNQGEPFELRFADGDTTANINSSGDLIIGSEALNLNEQANVGNIDLGPDESEVSSQTQTNSILEKANAENLLNVASGKEEQIKEVAEKAVSSSDTGLLDQQTSLEITKSDWEQPADEELVI
ncbi:MAG: hypothetical protein BRC33_00010 [Cyanobacteria bacterium SW_9_44_58]|nr:MAG: hypothetical protein BRC33_00010 [Cyanobacteria bacterium SW_9_44_58]